MSARYPVILAIALLLLANSAAAQEVKTLGGHTGEVFSVAWSPDGTRLASGSRDDTVRIWDNFTGSTLKVLAGHTDAVRSVSWSPDGTRLASGSDDQTIRIWDPETGSTLETLTGNAGGAWSVAWSPDGSSIAAGFSDKTIRIWNLSAGPILRTLKGHTDGVFSVAWSPDGTRLASGSRGNTVRIWDASTGSALRTLAGHTGPVKSIAWSPDGARLASGSFDRTIRIWDSSTGSTLRTLTGHTDSVLSIAWSPDGTKLASGSLDRTVRIWDASTGSTLRTLTSHPDWVLSIAWSPDGTHLASGSADWVVRIWDASTVPSFYPAIAAFSAPLITAISSLLLVSLAILLVWKRQIQATRAAPIPVPTGGRWTRWEVLLLVGLISSSLALRLALFPIPGFAVDLNYFAAWHAEAATNLSGFYGNVWSNYPPLDILVFSLIGRVEGAAGLLGSMAPPFDATELVFLKLPQNLADLAIPVLLYAWLRPKGTRVALLGAAAYAFNPVTIFDLAVWGQWDSLYTVFMVASLMAVLKRRFELSGALLALAVLTKPQGVLLLPVIAYVLLQEGGLKRTISSGLVAGVVVLAVIAPFQGASNPAAFITERYLAGYGAYELTSLDAYNFWALAGMWTSDQRHVLGLSFQSWGWLGFLSVAGFLMWQLDKRYPKAYAKTEHRDRLFLQVAFLTVFAFFMLSTRIHERYLFPALALLVMAWPRDRLFYFALTGSYLFNVAYALYHMNSGVYAIQDWTIPVFVGFNAMLFVWVLRQFWRGGGVPSKRSTITRPKNLQRRLCQVGWLGRR